MKKYSVILVSLMLFFATKAIIGMESTNSDQDIVWTSEDIGRVKIALQNELDEFCNANSRVKLCWKSVSLGQPNENIVFDKNVNHFIDSPVRNIALDIFNENEDIIGVIRFNLRLGEHSIITAQKDPIHIGRIQFTSKNPPRSASLDRIEMFAKGYANDVLATLHKFLDKIGADYTLLGIASKNPAAGYIYKKAGYVFTPKTLMAIKNWGLSHNISANKAEEEFLKDTDDSKPERNIGQTILMVRFKR